MKLNVLAFAIATCAAGTLGYLISIPLFGQSFESIVMWGAIRTLFTSFVSGALLAWLYNVMIDTFAGKKK